MSTLHMVATPIGNLGDVTYRAIETIKNCDFLICEDTRRTGILCQRYEINVPKKSFHAQSGAAKLAQLIDQIQAADSVAYVSDAGTPCISDPGYRLVRACVDADITVVPIPGPCAMTALLSVGGIPTVPMTWYGFLPHKKGRQTLMQEIAKSTHTSGFYESVHRFEKMLNQLHEHCEEGRYIIIGRELTKQFEEVFRGTITDAIAHFTAENTRGEFAIFVAPKGFSPHTPTT